MGEGEDKFWMQLLRWYKIGGWENGLAGSMLIVQAWGTGSRKIYGVHWLYSVRDPASKNIVEGMRRHPT